MHNENGSTIVLDRSHLFKSKSNTACIFYLLFIREVVRVNPKSKVTYNPTVWSTYTQVDNPT